MALSVKHAFQSLKIDGADTSLVRPSNWNAEHVISGQAYSIPMRAAGTTGTMTDVPIGDSLFYDATSGKLDVNFGSMVAFFAANAVPAGWLKANGAAVSRTTYANLFAKISTTYGAGDGSTTFNLPDLRGYFPRGFDDGRGVDPSRVFGSSQADAYLSHAHSGTTGTVSNDHSHFFSGVTDVQGNHTHTYRKPPEVATDTRGTNTTSVWNIRTTDLGTTDAAGAHQHNYSGNTGGISANHTHAFTTSASGGTETRPKNVALLACIKY